MWESYFDDGLNCWTVQTLAGYPLLEGEWGGRLRFTNESNARLVAAALNDDELEAIHKQQETPQYTVVPADKAADFGLSPMLAGARRMGHLL